MKLTVDMIDLHKAASKMISIPQPDADDAYQAGVDACLNGGNPNNCHYAYFETPELTTAWEQGQNDGQISKQITAAYRRDLDKLALTTFKEVSRYSRKYGFPLVCTLGEKPETELLHWAACLLVEVGQVWPREDLPQQLTLVPGSALYQDAKQLLENGLSNHNQVMA